MNMKDLAKKYNLTKNDYWQESRSKKYIITHDACEKIADIDSEIEAKPRSIVIPRFFSSIKLSVSVPVMALTRDVLP